MLFHAHHMCAWQAVLLRHTVAVTLHRIRTAPATLGHTSQHISITYRVYDPGPATFLPVGHVLHERMTLPACCATLTCSMHA
eukprot:366150-Chlamydomonas_euryale.AAC.11